MIKLDLEIENQFKEMGFPNYKGMAILPANKYDADGILYMEKLTTVFHPRDKTKFTAGFIFGVAYPEDNTPYYIQSVYAMLLINSDVKQLPLIDIEYSPLNSKLPTKEQIIDELFKSLNVQKIRERFEIGKNKRFFPMEPKHRNRIRS